MTSQKTADEIPTYLRQLFDSAVQAAMPSTCIPSHLPALPTGRTLVVAIGKAAASMSRVVEENWPKDRPLSGIALTRYGHGEQCERIKVVEASHPVPDDKGFEITKEIIKEVRALGENDLLLFLVSGGGSALMTAPANSLSLVEKKSINKALLMSGAPIGEMNIVRKHLSSVKGGRLAQMAVPAKIVTLAISDVPGDDPSTIASGPTVPDNSTLEEAREIVSKYNIEVTADISKHLLAQESETPKRGDPAFVDQSYTLITTPNDMLSAVVAVVSGESIPIQNLGADVEGEAREVALQHAELVFQIHDGPKLILSGGETTVTVAEGCKLGKGGRNCEYLLALAIALDGEPTTYVLAADTDGIDGSETNAGAIITPDTLKRSQALGLDAQEYLDRHDSFSFFKALGDLVVTGPTRTNVNDFRAIWTGGSSDQLRSKFEQSKTV